MQDHNILIIHCLGRLLFSTDGRLARPEQAGANRPLQSLHSQRAMGDQPVGRCFRATISLSHISRPCSWTRKPDTSDTPIITARRNWHDFRADLARLAALQSPLAERCERGLWRRQRRGDVNGLIRVALHSASLHVEEQICSLNILPRYANNNDFRPHRMPENCSLTDH